MANNSAQVALMKQLAKLQKQIKMLVPEIYACFAKALIDQGKGVEEIEDLFVKTQTLWQDNIDNIDDMITFVMKETGIDVRAL